MKKITCVIDNAVKPSSPFWGEHGLAFLIETESHYYNHWRHAFDGGR